MFLRNARCVQATPEFSLSPRFLRHGADFREPRSLSACQATRCSPKGETGKNALARKNEREREERNKGGIKRERERSAGERELERAEGIYEKKMR